MTRCLVLKAFAWGGSRYRKGDVVRLARSLAANLSGLGFVRAEGRR